MIKYHLVDNKIVLVIDAVRFKSFPPLNFDLSILNGRDYRVIITHGIMGEVLGIIEKNYYGLDKNKLIFLTNNIEITQLLGKYGCRCINIGEYVFLNDDWYNMIDIKKEYDSIYMGRRAKLEGLFNTPYKSNLKQCILNEESSINPLNVKIEYNKSLSGIMVSKTEGSCRAVAEMLMCGLPIVSIKMPNIDNSKYYPNNERSIDDPYNILLPNTIGGRELWLDDYNSIVCDRNDLDIDNAIHQIIEKKLDNNIIKNNFMSRLFTERLKFLFLIKSVLDELSIEFDTDILNNIVNLPYGNCSIQSTQWNQIIKYFKSII
jgi:glycosyltransferase involved in cell wall biosynthesis